MMRRLIPSVVVVLVALSRGAAANTSPIWHMKVTCFRPGSALWLGLSDNAGFPLEAFERLILVEKNRQTEIKQLNDLGAHMQIRKPQQALEFVRLRTSPWFTYAWNRGFIEGEIVSQRLANELPDYGFKSRPDKGRAMMWPVVPDRYLQHSPFWGPEVKRRGPDYVVTRWISHGSSYINDVWLGKGLSLWLIEETVSPKGHYAWKILRSMPPPSIKDVTWRPWPPE